MTYEGRLEKRYAVSPSREAICRFLGHNSKQALPKHLLQSAVMKKDLVGRIQMMIRAK